MSAGLNRLPLSLAVAAARCCAEAWKMGADCPVVGSIRRRAEMVGDIEFIAPFPGSKDVDRLFQTIQRTAMPSASGPVSLFDASAEESVVEPFVIESKGLKPGFKTVSLKAHLTNAQLAREFTVAVQIYRYTEVNRGWIEIMRTGPAEFGKWILYRWKIAKGIPESHQASEDGFLRNSRGDVVPTPTERAVFAHLGMGFIEPEDRAAAAGVGLGGRAWA